MCSLLVAAPPGPRWRISCIPTLVQDGWSGRLVRVLNAAPLGRSEQAVTLMIAVIDAGGLDEPWSAGLPQAQRRRLHPLHGISGESAASGSRLVAAWLRRRLALLIADGAYARLRDPATAEARRSADDPGSPARREVRSLTRKPSRRRLHRRAARGTIPPAAR